MSANLSFGVWLKQRRKTLDLTREELAQRLGCAVSTLYKLEADERRPSKQLAELLADHLRIAPDERDRFIQRGRFGSTGTASVSVKPQTNLPPEPTLLVGREDEITKVHTLLSRPEVRLLTLIGAPGIGKTRLALAVAAQMQDDFSDGVFLIALASLFDANLVMATIATTLGLADSDPQVALERLKTFLHNLRILLILDNFEQVLSAAPPIGELLSACPQLKILVTSRAPLRIRYERQLPVPALSLPDLNHLPDVENIARYSAISLFIERAQAVKPDFALTSENARAVSAICARLDGLPLAIELISARVKLLPPVALLERLQGRLLLQSDGLRDLEPRHRTLNAAIEWSYQLLNSEEQTLFRRLGVFVGGCTLEAVEAVCMDALTLPLLDGLASLLDKNLIKQDVLADGTPHFSMLETIREFAIVRLTASGELAVLRDRHINYFTDFVGRIRREIYWVSYKQWLSKMEAELANFRAALAQDRIGILLATDLGMYWMRRDLLTEGRGWLSEVLVRQQREAATKALTSTDLILRVRAIRFLAIFCTLQGDWELASTYYEECLMLVRSLDQTHFTGKILCDFGMLLQARGEYERAAALIDEGLAIHYQLGRKHDIAYGLYYKGTLAYTLGQTQQATVHLEQSLLNFRLEQHMGHVWGLAAVLAILASVMLDLGDRSKAHAYIVESLVFLRELDERWQTFHTLEICARFLVEQNQFTSAALLYGAAELLRDRLGAPILSFQQVSYERGLTLLRTKLNSAILMTAWAEGRLMTPNQAIDYALETITTVGQRLNEAANLRSARLTHPSLLDPLSKRELEVLRLISDGLSNAEIADTLYLSVGTVKAHTRSIFSKLGVNSRTQAVAQAHNLKLL